MSPIQQAAFELDVDRLAGLAKVPADLSGALLSACSAHDADPERQETVIDLLLSHGADPNETDRNGVSALHRAVRFRSAAAVRKLIARRVRQCPRPQVAINPIAPSGRVFRSARNRRKTGRNRSHCQTAA